MNAYDEHQSQARGVAAGIAVLTLSDTRAIENDVSGAAIARLCEHAGHRVAERALIRDDPVALLEHVDRWIADARVDVIITTGGTGIAPRDRTIPAVESRLRVRLDGFGELFRMLSWEQVGSGAMLSRALAGAAGDTLIFALPGSTRAVELAMTRLILPELSHLLKQLRG